MPNLKCYIYERRYVKIEGTEEYIFTSAAAPVVTCIDMEVEKEDFIRLSVNIVRFLLFNINALKIGEENKLKSGENSYIHIDTETFDFHSTHLQIREFNWIIATFCVYNINTEHFHTRVIKSKGTIDQHFKIFRNEVFRIVNEIPPSIQ
jgi:hypothetical protein